MRREDRKIVSKEVIEHIIEKAEILRVAFSTEDQPYIVPVNFGYHDNTFYFHCATEGKKLEMMKNNPKVAFELEGKIELMKGKIPCEFTMAYESIMGKGIASIIEKTQEKINGLNTIMRHYSKAVDLVYKKEMLKKIVIVRIDVEEMTGKKSK